ncbi:hypothetical protein C8Q69DRAFT_410191 [Paecilomyces variotii]|uniref:Uncharacterized protein n=1 Tax=Byssochlamys spectabilis TaxID=264951 RepID=A0A443HHG0_BYSSP|nr:hypothetical protein C8Q69DRAFT_410191 [Paecilomyces variotii]KAJ9316144.1 hypothetical protein DTO271D3_3720 [Paecilomyces variotii]KAJ9349944.1 hypothetical protein DTO280E4_8859 [Paecilomyces variotii]RWQ91207.1 hypothetical protein C8Q69DRAFT_410191 [Paecilomyces variotii]
MKKQICHFHSICIPQTSEDLDHPADVESQERLNLVDQYHSELLKISPRETWSGDAHLKSVPYPILGTEIHQRQLSTLSDALVLAITDIVERWWTDPAARFPERMPIEPVEEELLRWMHHQEPNILRPFKSCSGSWRPDFLLESSPEGPEETENYRICEINARFCWNGFLYTAFGQQALLNMNIESFGLRGATDPQTVISGLQGLYNAQLPLHLVKGEEYGYDIHMFVSLAQRVLGIRPRVIHPHSLRLMPAASPGGYKLYCVAEAGSKQSEVTNEAGEILEEIYQLGLELHQRELLAMSFEMLQQISLRCFNDMRTVLLVHDKRMLGLVQEELSSLVTRNVLTPHEADALDRGIVPTIIPGSEKLERFISQCQETESLKDQYILKPVRSGKGVGILFGDQLTHEEWMSALHHMQCPRLIPSRTTYVVQKRVEQRRYDVLFEENDGVQSFPLVGTFHIVHGSFLGLGLWRSGPGRICALSRGGAWMCSVMKKD